jgi:hypothetical protein
MYPSRCSQVRVERADAARIQVVHDALEQRDYHLGGGAHASASHHGHHHGHLL